MTIKDLIEKLQTQTQDAFVNSVRLVPMIDLGTPVIGGADDVRFEPDTRFDQPNGIRILFDTN